MRVAPDSRDASVPSTFGPERDEPQPSRSDADGAGSLERLIIGARTGADAHRAHGSIGTSKNQTDKKRKAAASSPSWR
jgi:hypothetical protein